MEDDWEINLEHPLLTFPQSSGGNYVVYGRAPV